MAKQYYVSTHPQPDGYREVHHEECTFLPNPANREHLGVFSSCREALAAARKKYTKVDGCKFCSPECHTR